MLKGAPYRPMIPAKDIERARRFYEDVLGLSLHRESPWGITYATGDGFVDLYLTEFAGTGRHTVGTWRVDDLRATMAELRGHGVTLEEYDMPGIKTVDGVAEFEGDLFAWFKDTEDNILGLAQVSERV